MLFQPPIGGENDAGTRLRSRARAFSALVILALLALTLIATDEEMLVDHTPNKSTNAVQDPRVVSYCLLFLLLSQNRKSKNNVRVLFL